MCFYILYMNRPIERRIVDPVAMLRSSDTSPVTWWHRCRRLDLWKNDIECVVGILRADNWIDISHILCKVEKDFALAASCRYQGPVAGEVSLVVHMRKASNGRRRLQSLLTIINVGHLIWHDLWMLFGWHI